MLNVSEDKIYQILSDLIFTAQLIPGQKLMETSLAKAFGVSRTPIRAVLQRLKYNSLIEIIPQKGAFVYCPSPKEAEQIFFLRQILEPEATKLAALNASESQIDSMHKLLAEETELYANKQSHHALMKTKQLHMQIIEASGNQYLIECLTKIISLSHIILAFYDISDHNGCNAESQHVNIVNAIRDRNALLAYDIAAEHVPSIIKDIDYTKRFNQEQSFSYLVSRYCELHPSE